jgi:uncharacterized protein YdeI (YjbR/CyaY-like superfamily)
MPKTSPDVDRYIANAPEFAQPILTKIRKAFHKACPDIEETMKWSVPFFDYKGVVGSMAAFKQHVGWGFWKGKLMSDPEQLMQGERTGMGGMRVESVKDLPSEKIMIDYIKEAVRLNEEGVKSERVRAKKPALEMPDDLAGALKKNKAASKAFEGFAPGQRREYIEWITGAKQEATRKKRLDQAIEWIAEGKPRNWKYIK